MRIVIAGSATHSRMLLQRAAERLGHQVRLAGDGTETLRVLHEAAADVVISDWLTSGVNVIELCRSVRSLAPETSSPYLIISTTLKDREHALTAMAAGADDYIITPVDPGDLSVRLKVAEQVTSLTRQMADQRRELERLNQRLFDQARRDPLTGLGNRMRLQEDLEMLRSQARRYGYTFSILLFDVDHFQRYNERYGHTAGDDVLRTISHLTLATCRSGDGAYRYGGEEFLLMLPEQTLASAGLVAERLRAAIEEVGIPHPDNPPSAVVTISVGAATLLDSAAPDTSLLLQQADAALYQAKNQGRNRAQLFNATTVPVPLRR